MDNNKFDPNNFKKFEDNLKNRATDVKASAKKYMRNVIFVFVAFIILASLSNFIYIVEADEVATVKRFGEITAVVVDKDNTLAEAQNLLTSVSATLKSLKTRAYFSKYLLSQRLKKTQAS